MGHATRGPAREPSTLSPIEGEEEGTMQAHGKGKLVPTGKSEPTLDVSYGISHPVSDENDIGISSLQKKKAVVHFILCDNGRPVPPR
jgi:hypothetical protein